MSEIRRFISDVMWSIHHQNYPHQGAVATPEQLKQAFKSATRMRDETTAVDWAELSNIRGSEPDLLPDTPIIVVAPSDS